MKFAVSPGAAGLAAALLVGPSAVLLASGQSAPEKDLHKRVEALEAGQKAILRELREIKTLLQQQRAPQPVPSPAPQPATPPQPLSGPPPFDITIAGSPSMGRQDSKLVIVEFSDFQCPFCGQYTRDTFKRLERDYVDTGRVRYVFRHFPLERLHPMALRAAEAADCAYSQGKFWEMHILLFANQQALAEPALLKTAEVAGLNMSAFQQCFSAQATSPMRVRQDQTEGARAAISGTPTFFIGTLTKEGKVHVLRRLVGAKPYAAFKSTLDELLNSPPS